MHIDKINSSTNFGARIKIKSDMKTQLADATTIGGFASSASSLISGLATDGMSEASAMRSKLIPTRFQRGTDNIKSILKGFFY